MEHTFPIEKELEWNEPTELFIKNIPYSLTSRRLKAFLEENSGKIRKIKLKKGWAIVNFFFPKDAKTLLHSTLIVEGRVLKVDFSKRSGLRRGFVKGEEITRHEPIENVSSFSMGYWVKSELFANVWNHTGRVDCTFAKGKRKLELEWQHQNDDDDSLISALQLDFIHRRRLKLSFKDIEHSIVFSRSERSIAAYIQLKSAPRIFSKSSSDFEDEDKWVRIAPLHFGHRVLKIDFSIPSHEQDKLIQYFESMSRFRIADEAIVFSRVTECKQPAMPRVTAHDFLQFDILARIEGLISKGILHKVNLTNEFYMQLAEKPMEVQKWILLRFECFQKRIFDPLQFLQEIEDPPTSFSSTSDALLTRRVIITPLRILINFPMEEVSNRIIRQFSDYADRFLRVSFTDEDFKTVARSGSAIYIRIYRFLKSGIEIAGRRFEFLAFSSSQLREHSCWFFASHENCSADDIRQFMGNFQHIKVVAKYAARMGQCFSSTISTIQVTKHEMIPDITIRDRRTESEYCFSDGIGKISPEFAKQVARALRLDSVPSVFQIRYKGCKGVVAVDPTFHGQIAIRKSMEKFETNSTNDFEVISWSKYKPCYLNRQVISILSTLGVKDYVFEQLQQKHLEELKDIEKDPKKAISLLQRCYSDTGLSTCIIELLRSGFPMKDPFIEVNLALLRARLTRDIAKRARVFVEKGACLIGVLDETKTLRYGQIFVQYKERQNQDPILLKGKVTTAKMPAFHPGDVRVLEAVDVPALRHLVNVVVFPAVGHRPHPNECSGSDLDGDIYWLSWDPNLLPPSQEEPMDYSAPKPEEVPRVTIDHVTDFVVKYIENDNLGIIANMHLAIADESCLGVRDEKCLKLAKLHSTAVDFPKTGVVAPIPVELRVASYPHFMENKRRVCRESKKVLGKLYEEVKKFQLSTGTIYAIDKNALKLDKDLLIEGYQQFIDRAKIDRDNYHFQLLSIMNQYGIRSEMEAVSGNVLKCFQKSKKEHEIRETIAKAVHGLRTRTLEEFNNQCKELSPYESKMLASAWYFVCYYKWKEKEKTDYSVSFAWIPFKQLCEIKRSWAYSKLFVQKK